VKRLAVLVAVLSSCKSSHKEQTPPTPPAGSAAGSNQVAVAPSDAADPWAKVDAAPDTPELRKKRAEAALARVAAIQPKLAKIRGLDFKQPVPTEYQLTDDFRTFLRKEIKKDLPPDKAAAESAAYLHLGLFKKPVDLAEVLEQTMATQAGAYYDPAQKKFFLVMVPDNDLMLDTMSAHELTHGLQDQHFDLTKLLDDKLDDDQQTARKFVVEGDATFAMTLYMLPDSGGPRNDMLLGLIKQQMQKMADTDLEEMKKQTREQSALFSGMDSDIKKSIDAMDDLPPAVLVPLMDSYTKGALVVWTAYEHGGWKAVDELYKHPPESTEQVLHPDTKLYPKREMPHRVTLPKPTDTEVTSNVMGELLWSVYFDLWVPGRGKDAAGGWAGDRYQVVKTKDGKLVGLIATLWDTPEDAQQFSDAYVASLAARFPGAGQPPVARPDGGSVLVKVDGKKVFIVDGGDDARLAQLVRGTRFE
jgi:hypothetical protein